MGNEQHDAATSPIHGVAYASQPDIQIRCTGAWTTPKWGVSLAEMEAARPVFAADNGDRYTFQADRITCEKCKAGPMPLPAPPSGETETGET